MISKRNKSESLESFEEKTEQVSEKRFISNESEIDMAHERWRKNGIAIALVVLVLCMNIAVMYLIHGMMTEEFRLIEMGKLNSESRMVESKVLLALIAGTVAQASALLVIAVKSVFK